MKSHNDLPNGYKEHLSLDLQNDKRTAVIVNVLSLVIAALLIIPAAFLVPISALFNFNGEIVELIRLIAIIVLIILYIILHESVHGIAMKICGTKKVKYGFTGMYAFAGSDDYYNKKAYIFIALAPVVLWGVVLAVVNFFVPVEWFWVIYIVQIINLSGAAGDFFVTAKFAKLPKDILVKDHGTGMTVFTKE